MHEFQGDENLRFDKNAGSGFEQPQAGPAGAVHMDVRSNPFGDDI